MTHKTPDSTTSVLESTKTPSFFRLAMMFIILICTWGAAIYYSYNKPFDPTSSLTDINSQTYNNQTINLDGYEYINCTFTNVTFVFHGTAPYKLIDAHFPMAQNAIQFTSPNPAIQAALGVVSMLEAMPGAKHLIKEVPKGQFQ